VGWQIARYERSKMDEYAVVRKALLEKMADPDLGVAEFMWLEYKLEQCLSDHCILVHLAPFVPGNLPAHPGVLRNRNHSDDAFTHGRDVVPSWQDSTDELLPLIHL